jgi:hypothetical protein
MAKKLTEIRFICQALDSDGKRCKNIARYIEHYHGDNEIYNSFDKNPMTWVEIAVCSKHLQTDKESENYEGEIDTSKFVHSLISEEGRHGIPPSPKGKGILPTII